MDSQNGIVKRKSNIVHTCIFVMWVVVSTVTYAALASFLCLIDRRAGRKVARWWNLHVLATGGVKLKVRGKEKLDPSERYVFMANHQSALDIPILYAGIGEQLSFIAKKELFMIPVFGWGMAAVGHIWIDRQNARRAHASIARAVRRLKKENVSLILFPEGTRSRNGLVGDFKSASFTLALKAGVSLVPVGIKGAIDRLPRNSFGIIPGEVELEIGDPVSAEELEGYNKNDLCQRVRLEIKEMVEERKVADVEV
ncbi:MAG: lysophospholipid acyltransferase family protein [Chitinispirillaceae bacterium]